MAKRTSKKSMPRKKIAKKPRAKKGDAPPAPHFSEQMMQGIFGRSRDRGFSAQEHAYDAMEAMSGGDWDRAYEHAMKAVKLDEYCIDALHILSQLGSENEAELIDNLRQTVERAERVLGPESFREYDGHFWGFLETRPYMRARAHLARMLSETGKTAEATEHYEDMLRLNPGDNQGLRYSLLGCYLETDNLAGAERLFSEFPDEGSAVFAWAQVLVAALAGDEPAATKTLAAAREANNHVEAYLTGRKKTPKDGPGYYSPGEPSEAIVCMHEIGKAWNMHPAAIDWLKHKAKGR